LRIEKVFLSGDGFGKVENVNYTDGVRILFDNGEIAHLRPSGNAPEFRNYAIADSQERASEMVRIGLEKVIPKLVEIISRF
jgi:phosphomannomutase